MGGRRKASGRGVFLAGRLVPCRAVPRTTVHACARTLWFLQGDVNIIAMVEFQLKIWRVRHDDAPRKPIRKDQMRKSRRSWLAKQILKSLRNLSISLSPPTTRPRAVKTLQCVSKSAPEGVGNLARTQATPTPSPSDAESREREPGTGSLA